MATPFDPSKFKMRFGRGTLEDVAAHIRAYPGVIEFDVSEDPARMGTVNIDLKLIERGFDERRFAASVREILPAACTQFITVGGQVSRYCANPFETVVFEDYDEDMSDAALAFRLKTLRG